MAFAEIPSLWVTVYNITVLCIVIWTLCMFMDFPLGCFCVTCQTMQYWKLMSRKTWSFLIGKRSIFTVVYRKLLPQCAKFKNHISWGSWTLKMEVATCSEKSTTIYHVCMESYCRKLTAYQNLCQNFKLPSAKFLILHGICSWNYRFLHYGHNSMHYHIDWKKLMS
jgi:hypothetical protein